MSNGCLEVNLVRLVDVRIVEGSQDLLRAESLRSANGRDDFFGQAAASRYMF